MSILRKGKGTNKKCAAMGKLFFLGAVAVLLAAILLSNFWAYSAPPAGGVEIVPFSWDTSSDPEQKLDAILHESDAIAAAMIASDLAWLPTEIGNTVGMAPFTEKRKACFNEAVAIAKVALSERTHATPWRSPLHSRAAPTPAGPPPRSRSPRDSASTFSRIPGRA